MQVLSSDGTQSVGKISKQWSGLAKELFTDADNFGIQCKYFVLHTCSQPLLTLRTHFGIHFFIGC